jgi:hypothetical protein
MIMSGVKPWQELEHCFLRFFDDDTRRYTARSLGEIRCDEHYPGTRLGECRSIAAVAQKAQLISRRSPKRCDAVYLDSVVTPPLTCNPVCKGTCGERAGTLTAECVRV